MDESAKSVPIHCPSPMNPTQSQTEIAIHYRNHRGELAERHIGIPMRQSGGMTVGHIWFGTTTCHPEPQWLLNVWDLDKKAERTLAMRDILAWGVAPGSPIAERQIGELQNFCEQAELRGMNHAAHLQQRLKDLTKQREELERTLAMVNQRIAEDAKEALAVREALGLVREVTTSALLEDIRNLVAKSAAHNGAIEAEWLKRVEVLTSRVAGHKVALDAQLGRNAELETEVRGLRIELSKAEAASVQRLHDETSRIQDERDLAIRQCDAARSAIEAMTQRLVEHTRGPAADESMLDTLDRLIAERNAARAGLCDATSPVQSPKHVTDVAMLTPRVDLVMERDDARHALKVAVDRHAVRVAELEERCNDVQRANRGLDRERDALRTKFVALEHELKVAHQERDAVVAAGEEMRTASKRLERLAIKYDRLQAVSRAQAETLDRMSQYANDQLLDTGVALSAQQVELLARWVVLG